MASVEDIIEAGKEYTRQVAASNPTITTKPPSVWFQEIADKLAVDMALSEMTLEYNLSLLEGEDPMTGQEMAEQMEEKMGGGNGEEKHPDPCDYDLDFEKHSFSRWWAELRKALGGVEKVDYLTAREYYLAKRGEL